MQNGFTNGLDVEVHQFSSICLHKVLNLEESNYPETTVLVVWFGKSQAEISSGDDSAELSVCTSTRLLKDDLLKTSATNLNLGNIVSGDVYMLAFVLRTNGL